MAMPAADQQPYSKLIILCGPPRSGTTWLNRELCNAATTFPFLPECTLLTQQIELYHRTAHYCDQQRIQAYFSTQENMLDYFRENLAKLINQTARINQKSNATTLILKDPCICLYLTDLKDLLPPHKLVVLVRDPRDVLASMKNVTAKKQQKWDVQDAAEQLINYYYQIGNHQQRADKDCLFVRYEDIVAGEKTTMLQDFLQLPVMSAMSRNPGIAAMREQLNPSDPFYSELYLQPTTSEKIGSYAKILSRNEIRHIETTYSGVIRHWGYRMPSSVKSIISSIIRS